MWPAKPVVCDGKKCQSTKKQNYEEGQKIPVCSDKNCQDTKLRWPLQPAKKKSCYVVNAKSCKTIIQLQEKGSSEL